jgi:hypothetical protein
MHDLFIIFVILLVLLTFISTFGGSIYAKENYGGNMYHGGMHHPESFEYQEDDGIQYQEEEDVEYDAEVEEYEDQDPDTLEMPEMPEMPEETEMPQEADTYSYDQGTDSFNEEDTMDMPQMEVPPMLDNMPSADLPFDSTTDSTDMLDVPAPSTAMNPMDTIEGFDGDMYAAF